MTSFKTQAHIHSLNGAMDEITVLDSRQDGVQTVYIVSINEVIPLQSQKILDDRNHRREEEKSSQ